MFDIETAWDRPAHTGPESDHILRIRIIPGAANSAGMPLHMAIALDTSSSMQGEKLEKAKESCKAVYGRLRPGDKLWLGTYSMQVNSVLDAAEISQFVKADLDKNLSDITAKGVTRTDLALRYLKQCLTPKDGTARVAALITDGYPTNSEGSNLKDYTPLISIGKEIGDEGGTLLTVGLGDAGNFNTGFLVSLCDQTRGGFLYAKTTNELEPLLESRLSKLQAIAVADARIEFKPLVNGVTVKALCRYSPEFSPMDAPEEGTSIRIGTLSGNDPTVLLAKVSIPQVPLGQRMGTQEILDISLRYDDSSHQSLQTTVSVQYTNSYSESMQLNKEVNDARLMWEINTHMTDLANINNPNQTKEILDQAMAKADKLSNKKITQELKNMQDDLKKTGKRNDSNITTTLTITRDTENLK